MFTPDRFITDRLRGIDASGIRRVFDLAANLEDPVNLSIGQPDFDVPAPIKRAAVDAIERGFNRYTPTQGMAELRARATRDVAAAFPRTMGEGAARPEDKPQALRDDLGLLITSGVSGGLMLALLTCVEPGDEVLIPDPYFVMYRHLVTLAGGTPVYVDTYPDFQVTVERIEPHVTEKTKLLLFNSPSNPTGVTASEKGCQEVAALCDDRDILLLSDEIYDEFCHAKVSPRSSSADHRPVDHRPADVAPPHIEARCPSPAAFSPNVLLMRGFSKSYGMTGWRLGYAVGPAPIIEQMTKLQQYSFVCAPSMTQAAGVAAMDVDMSDYVEAYRGKRDRVVEMLSPHYELTTPDGAFYAFPKVPERLGMTGSQFVEQAIARNLLIIPGNVFSQRDTHFRLSYACDDAMLDRGLDLLVEMAAA